MESKLYTLLFIFEFPLEFGVHALLFSFGAERCDLDKKESGLFFDTKLRLSIEYLIFSADYRNG